MLKPKASHLVERVAEKLLRSGALEDSAAQLLDPELAPVEMASAEPVPPPVAVAPAAPEPAAPLPARRPTRAKRSALFAPPPDQAAAAKPVIPKPVPAPLRPVAPIEAFPASNVVEARPRRMSSPDSPVRLAAPSIVERDPTQADVTTNPDILQGRTTVDAVALERGGMVDWSRTRSRISEEFRLVQRQILRTAFGPGSDPGFSNLLMVTSARPGEGKSC